MRIAGFLKNSFVDYPGNIASVVFVPGCNMDCWYCHNRHLWQTEDQVKMSEIDTFLDKRVGFIDGVVITGGEPTLHSDLPEFIQHVKSKGYKVKLDTNGLRPDVIEQVSGDIDYIAMDIKAPPGGISSVVSFDIDENLIWQSAQLIMNSGVDYEFRTTMMPLLKVADIESIAKRISGAKRYALQQYRISKPKGDIKHVSMQLKPLGSAEIKKAAKAAERYLDNVIVRGI
ncbi:MAG: anaerobic ribonucleoside-triphosphate reductase activating protein [Clostridia bacterium]|jgi:pyruvate formate lyase activating enzyme|nr:anaerobic ribonucleoside-triphosphate reductase activating protein [Clostridia bacterium]MBT7122780.1 anaerobic ribonucleoside-triphosphate reductase activating protein [Clostridia bacterium]